MKRQCAWCLRLINCAGERISVSPVPKVYEASHGMCAVCSALWLEAFGESLGSPLVLTQSEDGRRRVQHKSEILMRT